MNKTTQFKNSVYQLTQIVRVKPSQVRLQKMTRKWASCSARGWVTFSFDLLDEAEDFQRYVIIHELLHLKIPNHGKLFKSLLSVHFPNWKKFHGKNISDRVSDFSDYSTFTN